MKDFVEIVDDKCPHGYHKMAGMCMNNACHYGKKCNPPKEGGGTSPSTLVQLAASSLPPIDPSFYNIMNEQVVAGIPIPANQHGGSYFKEKYEKYKAKYLGLKKKLTNDSNFQCEYNASSERAQSNCDRIIYKKDGNIKFSQYDVINKDKLRVVEFSDHKMIYGKFKYNNEDYMLFSWNMGAFDHKYDESYTDYIKEDLLEFLKNSIDKDVKYLLFSFQESIKNSLFIKVLTEIIKDVFDMNLIVHKLSNPILANEYYVQLLVFSNQQNIKIKESGYKNFTMNTSIKDKIKSLIGTKSYVYANINDLMIVSTHFPIDTKKEDLGNNLRISAYEEIERNFSTNNNLIVVGDLNFRNLNNRDQLTELLKVKSNFIEAGNLKEKTCKFENCKLKCDKKLCVLHQHKIKK
jgi:hypothetical protein